MPDNLDSEIDFLTPEQAEPILKAEAEKYLAEGWKFDTLSNYVLRLKQDDQYLDIQVDLTGEVTIEQKQAAQTALETGRLWAWLFLWVFMLLAFAFAKLINFI